MDPVRRLLRFKIGGRFYFVDLDEYLQQTQEFSDQDKEELISRIDRLESQFQAMQNVQ